MFGGEPWRDKCFKLVKLVWDKEDMERRRNNTAAQDRESDALQ